MKRALVVVAVSALAVAAGAFPATARYGLRPLDVPVSGGTPVDDLPTPFSHGGSCVKICEYDNTPCDPDYWKVADRRCNYNQRGSY
jgi:hypothetical protein